LMTAAPRRTIGPATALGTGSALVCEHAPEGLYWLAILFLWTFEFAG
jgi:hypothetical protein